MKRLLVISAGILAAVCIAAAPAVAGLSDNPSFSHQIPIRVPTQVTAPHRVHGTDLAPSPTAPNRHGASRSAAPGDVRGSASTTTEPGDDRGSSSTATEPGDDRGRSSTATEPGGDRGGDSDDTGGHGASEDGGSHG